MGLTTEQIALRKTGITATDAPAILGFSPYRAPIDVWLEKQPDWQPAPPTFEQALGLRLEPIVCELWKTAFAESIGLPEEHVRLSSTGTIQSKYDARIIATPDRIATLVNYNSSRWRNIQAKTANGWHLDGWGLPGTDEVPEVYLLQVQWEMLAGAPPVTDIPVLIHGNDFRIYTVESDPDLQAMMRDRCLEWFERHVVKGVEPEPDASRSYSDYLKARYSKTQRQLTRANPEAEEWAGRLLEARRAMHHLSIEEALAENALRAIAGDAAGLEGDGWRYRATDIKAFEREACTIQAHRRWSMRETK